MHKTFCNVTDAWASMPDIIRNQGVESNSRNGKVYRFQEPFTMTIQNPQDNLLINQKRMVNPTAVLMESLWVLGGRNDIRFLTRYLKNLADYSDDGLTWRGAYGHRLRTHFGKDQIATAIMRLNYYKEDRRTVLAMWDPTLDLNTDNHWKDIPCNDMITLKVRDGKLDMTVFARGNDIVWGLLNVNVVEFTLLQQYIAAQLEIPVGKYSHVTDDLHMYEATNNKDGGTAHMTPIPLNLFNEPGIFMHELKQFMREHDNAWDDPAKDTLMDATWKNNILNDAAHMVNAFMIYKDGSLSLAKDYLNDQDITPWLFATKFWYNNRKVK